MWLKMFTRDVTDQLLINLHNYTYKQVIKKRTCFGKMPIQNAPLHTQTYTSSTVTAHSLNEPWYDEQSWRLTDDNFIVIPKR